MAVEIERKFLVKDNSWKSQVISKSTLSQGYLANFPPCTIRVRVKDAQGFLTVKGPTHGISRAEYEYPIPVEEAREMMAAFCTNALVEKTRYCVEHAGKIWEVDVFEGRNKGLILAEIELKSEHEEFDLPEWVAEEVSGQLQYYNSQLIKNPFCDW